MTNQLPKIALYRNISVTFIVFTIMLLVAVFLLFSGGATIIIIPQPQKINLSFKVTVKENPPGPAIEAAEAVTGRLVAKTLEGAGDFSVLSTKTASGDLVGQVKIINNSSKNQPLLKTTQLEADNGIIVRTNEYLVVPAKGAVTVAVYPKEPQSFLPIAPGKLTIIKLNPNLQDEIYAVNEGELNNQPKAVKVLAESDINRAKEELTNKLVSDLKQQLGLTDQQIAFTKIVAFKTDKKIGEETDIFNFHLTLAVRTVEINQEQLINLMAKRVANLNLAGLDIDKVNLDDLKYSIINDDFSDGAMIKINYVLLARINGENEILNKNNFFGKKPAAVKQLLLADNLIKETQIIISPSWRQTLPSDALKIKIIIR